jgi:hypothetical protein
MEHLTVKISFAEMKQFTLAIPIGPIVPGLSFIKNKKYWGHSFRNSPIRITISDYETILRDAS